ncbi:UNVERIFIED_CONTAM: hypothetical protein Sindi_0030500 [Sesamum indicum]
MSWFWTIIFLCVAFTISSEGKHHKKHPSAVVVGTVYCDTCFQQDFPKASHFISGASVAVECKTTSSKPSFQQVVKTDKNGEFRVHLPFSVSKHVKKIKKCAVQLISSNEPFCAVAATAASSSLSLKTRKHGTHVFSAGFFTFKPLKQPEICNQKPSISSFKNLESADKPSVLNPNDPLFPPPLQDPSPSDPPTGRRYLPPLPQLPNLPPLPELPRLPPLPVIPFLPPAGPKKTATNFKASELSNHEINQPKSLFFPPNPLNPPSLFPPNPLLPPPSLIPPVLPSPPPSIFPPLVPSPPPSVLPPLFPSPPSPPFFHLPPIPGLTPSPPPPPPPVFPIPLPPFPFQPTPGFPGVPPAGDASSPSKTSSP